MKAAVYIPTYQSEAFISAVTIPAGMDCVVMDNHSTDGTVQAARKRGFTVVEHEETVPRTENWLRCITHFKRSEYDWMKWLFTGDELAPDLLEKLEKAVQRCPDAGIMIFPYEICSGSGKIELWQPYAEAGGHRESPYDAVHRYAQRGNIFGSPVGMCFRRDVETEGLEEALAFEWAADAHMAMLMARHTPVFFAEGIAGRFNSRNRMHFQRYQTAFHSTLEDVTSRLAALAICRTMGLPDEAYRRERDEIESVFERSITLNFASHRAAPGDWWAWNMCWFKRRVKHLLQLTKKT